KVVLEAGAQVIRSTVRGPTVIAAGARIEDSYVGPYSAIDSRCVIVRSEVEHAIVLADSSVTDVRRIEDSLIGKESVIRYSDRRPRAYRLMVGDHSHVSLV